MLTAEVDIAGELLILHPFRALYWPRMHWLVVSDLHLGKAAHFRKAGTPLPEGHDKATLERLDILLHTFNPERLLILGDLFHSSHNNSWELFRNWASCQHARLHLVLGNHDILADRRYTDAGFEVCTDTLQEGPFIFSHEHVDRPRCYVISGHVHPGVMLTGLARQHLRLPCFSFGSTGALLPAFGLSTGTFMIRPDATHRVFATTDRAVLDVSTAFAGHQPSRQGE